MTKTLAVWLCLALSAAALSAQSTGRYQAPVVKDTGGLQGPRQPIFFRHDIHAGQYKMQCQYCHYSVALSPEPGIPSVQTCMGCHLVIGGSDSSHQTGRASCRERV